MPKRNSPSNPNLPELTENNLQLCSRSINKFYLQLQFNVEFNFAWALALQFLRLCTWRSATLVSLQHWWLGDAGLWAAPRGLPFALNLRRPCTFARRSKETGATGQATALNLLQICKKIYYVDQNFTQIHKNLPHEMEYKWINYSIRQSILLV